MLNVTESGTIDDLVGDAASKGYRVTIRLIRDWTAAGLLDNPIRRSAGKGHGALKALYPATQRELFITLLHHRRTNGIRSLAKIPIAIWLLYGEDYVALGQARTALRTWLDDAKGSKAASRQAAKQLLGQLDHPDATTTARRELREVLTDIAYTGRNDPVRLEAAIRRVFEPGFTNLKRAVGHPTAPLTADVVTDLIGARLAGARLLNEGKVSDDELLAARRMYLLTRAEYAARQPILVGTTPPGQPQIYEAPTLEAMINLCCEDLLTIIGLESRSLFTPAHHPLR